MLRRFQWLKPIFENRLQYDEEDIRTFTETNNIRNGLFVSSTIHDFNLCLEGMDPNADDLAPG